MTDAELVVQLRRRPDAARGKLADAIELYGSDPGEFASAVNEAASLLPDAPRDPKVAIEQLRRMAAILLQASDE